MRPEKTNSQRITEPVSSGIAMDQDLAPRFSVDLAPLLWHQRSERQERAEPQWL
ncbi:hypothetical protein SynBIOSE41_02101 [Synechococcus sp. BIOS-E4-1]|nr:hypothetical protein SynBIOSE41_02101 [Synechococcus sp. BIOS-E4-1]